MTDPLFSIVIANYNNGKYISETIESILNQTYRNFEIVIVDDASTDDSVQIVRKYLVDNRVKLHINTSNKGVGYVKRKGVELSSGTIIGTIGADDTLADDALEIMVNEHEKYPDVSLVYSTHYICNQDLKIIRINGDVESIPSGDSYLTYNKSMSSAISSFRTFKRIYYFKTDGFSPYFRKAVDKDIIYKLEEVGRTLFVNLPLYYYRHHSGSISLFKNETAAIWWEIQAKIRAYKRRKKNNFSPNLDQKDIRDIKNYYCQRKASDCLDCSSYFMFVLICTKLLFNKPTVQSLKFIYYLIKKRSYPEKYSNEKES